MDAAEQKFRTILRASGAGAMRSGELDSKRELKCLSSDNNDLVQREIDLECEHEMCRVLALLNQMPDRFSYGNRTNPRGL
ncbi:hypothetical protein HJC23_010780 [Cyclotella cryptica]|uniref:Uncharacterized protein n=1 Tax=Cyclotella cryptica TaxID=29204 RepID=A0ABD3PUZ8_9STRA